MRFLVEIAKARVDRAVDHIDRLAAGWLLRRTDLPRPLVQGLLEQFAARVGAKLEITELL
jgi:hypothetical protein